jgi:hypothetical protein
MTNGLTLVAFTCALIVAEWAGSLIQSAAAAAIIRHVSVREVKFVPRNY